MRGSGLPLGVDEDEVYENYAINIEAGGLLLCYTDGVLEHSRDLIKVEQTLIDVMHEAAQASQTSALHILQATMGGNVAHDDIAMLLLRINDV